MLFSHKPLFQHGTRLLTAALIPRILSLSLVLALFQERTSNRHRVNLKLGAQALTLQRSCPRSRRCDAGEGDREVRAHRGRRGRD